VAQAIAIVGGFVILLILIRFALLLWRKSPDEPGSNNPFGGMPGGGPEGDGH
jgi:hypothetical protein